MVQTIKESVKFWLVRWCMPLFVPFWFFTHFSVWQVLFEGDHWQSAMGPMESHQLPSDTIDSENSQKWRISMRAGPPLYFSSNIKDSPILFTPFQTIFLFFPPARATPFTPSKNIKFFCPIRREFFKPSQGIFSSFSQPGQKNFSHLQKILNSLGQSGESFSNPLKEYFLPSDSQGRKTFHTSKKY